MIRGCAIILGTFGGAPGFLGYIHTPPNDKLVPYLRNLKSFMNTADEKLGGGGRVTCICRDSTMCHYFGYFLGCSWIFGYLFGLFPDFWVSFLVKFDVFRNNQNIWVLILIFY